MIYLGKYCFKSDFRKTQTVGKSAHQNQLPSLQLGSKLARQIFIWEETEGLRAGAVVPMVHWASSDTFYIWIMGILMLEGLPPVALFTPDHMSSFPFPNFTYQYQKCKLTNKTKTILWRKQDKSSPKLSPPLIMILWIGRTSRLQNLGVVLTKHGVYIDLSFWGLKKASWLRSHI